MNPSHRPPITVVEYERLFRVIHAVLTHAGHDPVRSNLFFAVAGAFVLRHHHRLGNICPVAGAAGYALPVPGTAPLCFGNSEGDTLVADAEHHHCWIEADGWVIDLYAPLFAALLSARCAAPSPGSALPPRMFQRPALPPTGIERLSAPGGYLHRINEKLTTQRLQGFAETASYADLVRLCERWYVRPPKKIAPAVAVTSEDGSTLTLALSPLRLAGAW